MKNNLSAGIDIVSINRIKEILTSSKRERFLKKIFSSNEIKEAKSRHNEAQFFFW
jgi:phosphopantetheine--protein transferase-like protein